MLPTNFRVYSYLAIIIATTLLPILPFIYVQSAAWPMAMLMACVALWLELGDLEQPLSK